MSSASFCCCRQPPGRVRHPPASFRYSGGGSQRRAFPALHAETHDEDTLLPGVHAGQAALHGVLDQVEALGLELVEVRRLSATGASG
jgi:hypothetical protein